MGKASFQKVGAIVTRFAAAGKRELEKKRKNFLEFFHEILTISSQSVL